MPQVYRYPPDTYLGNPPKDYRPKKAVGLFVCWVRSFGLACYEILRARTVASGRDIYVIFFSGAMRISGDNLHESYHESGDFHWLIDGQHVVPLYSKEDSPAAIKLFLRMKPPLCYCFRKGRNLERDKITNLVSCLARYLPIEISIGETSREIWEKGFYRIIPSKKICNL